ncbi:trehalase [Lentinula raphanica]|uniref:Trehalase n=1 Tax=Lentinula raphanica TaxID=153919 RepID=A0AA38U4F1_9AGAR|nr:trehalase [Lentinula raphanica]KAJ3832169.1 trehalase [Lentinula raphanica]KAJ3966458.1 trehalase [Lentinula raphanica]
MLVQILAFIFYAQQIYAVPADVTSVSQISVTTSIASPTASLTAAIPSQYALPPVQDWCPSQIFCAGALLQTVNDASLWTDPKTFVDKPTSNSTANVLANFQQLGSGTITEGDVEQFVDTNFKGEGLELEALELSDFPENPSFLENVTDPLLKAWSQTVHGYWSQLIRSTNASALCPTGSSGTCESTLIALNHTFVIPGGRFREQYYWDSYWIIEGLLQSELYDIVNSTLQNFMDELETYGFIPNGGRIYYLNRSQPPLFIQMLSRYVTVTNDQSILERALPLAEKELAWWQNNRTVNVTSPYTNQTYAMAHYAVNNTAPRPESYLTDYETAHGSGLNLSTSELSDLYAELASGAETGWDYCSRFLKSPAPGNGDLTTLVVRETIPVDLNSILYKNHILLANLYGSNSSAANSHLSQAASIREGILDLFWNSTKLAFYDFSLLTQSRNNVFSSATWYPYWSGIIPDEVLSSDTNAFKAFSAVNMVLNRYNGSFPTTFLQTGLQWDSPNSWPNLIMILLSALKELPSNVTSTTLSTLAGNQSSFDLIPSGQLNLTESQLFGQPVMPGVNASTTGVSADINALNGTVVNGGNATDGEGWGDALQRMVANRYMASALCSWHATGGSISGLLPRLSDTELNVTQSVNNTGNMFEKFSTIDIDSSGSGGEYTVQAGFGWTNGVVLWIASNYGDVLVAPDCPDVQLSAEIVGSTTSTSSSAQQTSGASRPALSRAIFWVGLLAGAVVQVVW